MRIPVLLILLFILTLKVSAQNQELDKLRQQIKAHPQEDTARVNRLNELANSRIALTSDEIEKLATEALSISRKIGYTIGEGYALMSLGQAKLLSGDRAGAAVLLQQADSIAKKTDDPELLIYILLRISANTQQFDNKEALNYGLKAEELAQKTGNKILLSRAQNQVSSLYQVSFSDYSRAMEYAMKSVSVAEDANCLPCLATVWSNLGALYNAIGDQDKALQYYNKALEANKQLGNKTIRNNLLVNIGERYRLMGKYPEAIESYTESLKEQTSPYNIELLESNLADVYTRMDNLPLAFSYGFSSLEGAKKIDDIEGTAWIDGILSRAYLKKKMADSAIYYAIQGLDASKKTGTIEFMRDNAMGLSNAYAFKNDFKNAYNYQSLYFNYRDSMMNAQVSNKSTVLAYNYDLEKKQGQIAVLNQQKKLQQNFLISVLVVLLLIIITAIALLRNNRQKRLALAELKQTQAQLVQSEKMASLGELTAGIAHEIQNPLNFVNNFSEVNSELLKEMKEEIDKGNFSEVKNLANDLIDNSGKINQHGKRADAIVKGMLQHSRTSSGHKEPTDINAYADEYLRLSYHGMRAKEKLFNATLHTDFDKSIGKINIVSQDIGRVLLNLYNNAFYAVNEKKKTAGERYGPAVTVSTKKINNRVELKVKDNGNGIPQNIIDKIFQPFYTTKPAGQGTGLGLSLSYDIVKAHGGEIKVETKEGEGTEFIIQLPA